MTGDCGNSLLDSRELFPHHPPLENLGPSWLPAHAEGVADGEDRIGAVVVVGEGVPEIEDNTPNPPGRDSGHAKYSMLRSRVPAEEARTIRPLHALIAAVMLVLILDCLSRMAAPGPKGDTPPAPPPQTPAAPAALAAQPDVRIGLTTEPTEAKLSAAGGLLILHPHKLVPLWKARFDEPVVVVVDLPKGVAPRTIFRVQVGSFATQAEADALKDRLERLVPDPVIVSFNPERNSYRVRVGEFTKRDD